MEATYCGAERVHKQWRACMIPWVIGDLTEQKSQEKRVQLKIVEQGILEVRTLNEKGLILAHRVSEIARFCRCQHNRSCFAYFYPEKGQKSSEANELHVFISECQSDVPKLFEAVQLNQYVDGCEPSRSRSVSSAPDLSSRTDSEFPISDASTVSHFEVLYVGFVQLGGNSQVPFASVVDEAVTKFQQHPTDTSLNAAGDCSDIIRRKADSESSSRRGSFKKRAKSDGNLSHVYSDHCTPSINNEVFFDAPQLSSCSDWSENPVKDKKERNRAGRVMLLLVDPRSIRLISLSQKQILLRRSLLEVKTITQGIINPGHVGFLCNSLTGPECSILYILKCQSVEIADVVIQSVKAAFYAALIDQSSDSAMEHNDAGHRCQFCPMFQFGKLCNDVERLAPLEVHEVILQRIGQLEPEDQERILTEYKNLCQRRCILDDIPEEDTEDFVDRVSTNGFHRRNVVLMGLLRSLCQTAQSMHEVQLETSDSQSGDADHFQPQRKLTRGEELLMEKLGNGSGDSSAQSINKSSSFESYADSPMPNAVFDFDTLDVNHLSVDGRPRSRTVGEEFSRKEKSESRSPRFSMLSKLAETASTSFPNSFTAFRTSLDQSGGSPGGYNFSEYPKHRRMSWRQAIFSRVVSPRVNSRTSLSPYSGLDSPSRRSSGSSMVSVLSLMMEDGRGIESYYFRSLWKKVITEQILQNRIVQQQKIEDAEKENVNRMKLNYQEITPCSDAEVRPVWEELLTSQNARIDRYRLEEAVKAGIPPDMRAGVWKLLLGQHDLDKGKRARMDQRPPGNFKELMKELTSHQHAILIDLGRTFPSHPYFAQQLGIGQLSLFNILKAYSLYDPEVGYCQGLSFIAGALLLHMEEEDAFQMLADLMFKLGLRKQYRPDMMALQIEMYQLSRLLHDRQKDLHTHMEEHEIPMLYAAPWFLTLFASTFPLGFVARVFDCLFLSGGLDVIFKIAVVLLGEHKELIMQCNSFESINDFLKSTLPSMSIIQMERVFNAVFELDLSRDLLAYEVEYHVLQEEMLSSPIPALIPPPPGKKMGNNINVCANSDGASGQELDSEKLIQANKNLKRQNLELLEQLQSSHQKFLAAEQSRMEAEVKLETADNNVASLTCKVKTLESRIETLELERKSLLSSLRKRIDSDRDPTRDMIMENGAADDSGLFATPVTYK